MEREKWGIILAAGKGSRMQIDLPKCAIKLGEKTLIERAIDNLKRASVNNIICILGFKKEIIENIIKDKCLICYQKETLGTANAVLEAEKVLNGNFDIIIMAGDMPFISSKTINEAYLKYQNGNYDLLVLSAFVSNPYGYGRIIHNNNEIIDIKEERDCTIDERKINEVNSSVYIVKSEDFFKYLKTIKNNNKQHEYYLTDIVKIYHENNKKIGSYIIKDNKEIMGINDMTEFRAAEEMIKKTNS